MKRILLLVLLSVTGCVSNPGKPDKFPAGLESICLQQLNAAKAGIERCGTPLTKHGGVQVFLRKGDKKVNGMWCWPQGNWWIGGVTENSRIIVGCNPVTMGEVSTGVLFHEFGHYWLITNKSIHGHDPKYDPVFHWSNLGVNEAEPIY